MNNERKEKKQVKRLTHILRYVLTLTIAFSCSLAVGAQSSRVSGVVVDEKGESLIGATVTQKGVTNGTVTGIDGDFTLTAPTNATLVVTYVGYITQEVPLNGKTNLRIVLRDDSRALDEVVVTALGIKKQAKALGYAVSEVKGDDLVKGVDANAITALSGRMAGVDISSTSGGPSGSTRVIIRGNSQLTGSNLPLYVVDGVPMDNSDLGSAGKDGGYDMGDGLSSINPNDIESISVLKGASASALYGSRASNGVVIITTKSGQKGQKGIGIDVSMNVNAVNLASGFDDYQRVYGQGTGGQPPLLQSNAQTSTQSAWGAKLDPNMSFPIFNGNIKPYGNVNDNILSFFKTGVTYTNAVSFSNSTDKSDFRLSVSDMRNNDIVPSSDMYRTTIMMKGMAKLNDKLTIEGRANYTKEGVNNRPALSDSPNNIGNSIIGLAPNFNQKWLAEGYKDEFGRYNSWNANKYRLNPYWVINEMENVSSKNRIMGHVQMNYQILPYLSAQVKAGMDYYNFRFTDFAPLYTDGLESGQMKELSTSVSENNYEAMVRYTQRFGDKWDVSAFVGGNIMQYGLESFQNKGSGEVMPGVVSIMNYTLHELIHSNIRKQINSIYGAVNLGYGDFAYLDMTVRNDVSSTLASGNRSYTYPSFSGSFVFSELVDLKSYGLSFGKFRASWAKVGGDTDPYLLDLVYGLEPYTIGGKPLGTINSTVMPNRALKPTSTFSHEFGLDLRFLNNRVNVDFGYYYQITKDQIMQLPISSASGYTAAMINAGEIENKGIEVAISVIPVKMRDFEWTSTVNMSKNVNKVIKLHPDQQDYRLADARWAGAMVYASEGQPFGTIVGKKFNRNEAGEIIFTDKGMPTFDDKLSVLGNGNYDLILGFGNTFRYRNFNLGVLLDMKFGGDLYSMSAWQSYASGTTVNTLEGREEWYRSEEGRRAANATAANWTPTGGYVGKGVVNTGTADNPVWTENTVPVDPQQYWKTVTDNTPEPFIYDASYIKLRELTLSYNVPNKFLAKTPIQAMSISAFGRNLFILHSDLKNIDPESNYNNGNGQGLEYGSLPSRRTYGFGINLKF